MSNILQNDLFRKGPNPSLNACVGCNGGPYNFDAYSLGYFEAGNRLMSTFAAEEDGEIVINNSHIDSLVYPIVYLFRHAIALGLKFLGESLPGIWNESLRIELTHRLIDNWNLVRPYLERNAVFDPEQKLIEEINEILNQLVEIDPQGQTFRFPTSTRGEQHLRQVQHINLVVFWSGMEKVNETFEHWFRQVKEIQDTQQRTDIYL